MQRAVDAAERNAWERDGFFIRERVFSAREVEELRAAAERVARCAGLAVREGGRRYEVDGNRYHEAAASTIQFEHGGDSQTLRVIEPFHHLEQRIERLIDDPRLVEPMRDLVGSRAIALFTDKLNLKRPRQGSGFRWHQDSPYWAHFCAHLDRLPNAMVALDDASEENGCLRVIAGSHTRGCLPGLRGEGVLGPLFTDPSYFELSRQVPAVMPAGSILFFSAHSVHGSEPNHSGSPRRACVLTYQPAGHRMFKIDAERPAGEPPREEETRCRASMTSA